MGLITRTIGRAGINLLHFMCLFMLVFFGYAVVGNVMFGAQFKDMSTLAKSFRWVLLGSNRSRC